MSSRLPHVTTSSSLAGRLIEQIKSSGQHKGHLNATELTALEASLRDELPRNQTLHAIVAAVVNDGHLLTQEEAEMATQLTRTGKMAPCPKETLDNLQKAVAEANNQVSVLKKQEALIKKHLESLKVRRKKLESHWQENRILYRDQKKDATQKIKEAYERLLVLSNKETEFQTPNTFVDRCLKVVNESTTSEINGPEIAEDILDELCLIPGSEDYIESAYLKLVYERQENIKIKLVRLLTCLEKINSFYEINVSKHLSQREKTIQLISEYQSNEASTPREDQATAASTSRSNTPLDDNQQINRDSLETRYSSVVSEVPEDELDSLRKLLKYKMELATKNIPASS